MKPIQKLDTQLSNQIAAGEVVERPASVVKELLENSLDAGATRIDIEITSGGSGLIRIRDDGSGIPKDQLTLALSPHATSKISSLDDLDSIRSFGFRGEALSSISSVSRFTLSSRTIGASQGWQAEAEGRDMQVKLTPIAAAEGTRIDVRELFFNTPARRRFMRTEKTEFSHIEETVKKVVLANFKVAITLKHNGRMSRRYRAAHDRQQEEQRVAAVCGRQFMERSIRLDLEHQSIRLEGWLALPDYHRSQTDGQYFYVNNRPVKDRVLSHAIRQAYQSYLPEGRVPAYVLFLTIDPRKVDVNVHPTKHEVRFHDGRLIHDLLVQAIERGLIEGKELIDSDFLESVSHQHSSAPSMSQGYAPTAQDTEQHQAYRSLLQSVQGISPQGVSETTVNQIAIVGGWKFLSRLNKEYLLLEKENDFVLVTLSLLIGPFFEHTNNLQSQEFEKLLFPEILTVENEEDARLINSFFEQHNVSSSISSMQITIEKVPSWMTNFPIKTLCCELINLFYKEQLTVVNLPTSEESAMMFMKLLEQCDDIKTLKLKRIPKDMIVDYFNE
ncbi:MAG: DNA mismatch repair endonuclease MutL [Gammaproteobacteria bacterium]|nr:DNA mismatch repair endonuclease MutL [Gammaproteobacteria bacterium]